jgi:hypothetical protein
MKHPAITAADEACTPGPWAWLAYGLAFFGTLAASALWPGPWF